MWKGTVVRKWRCGSSSSSSQVASEGDRCKQQVLMLCSCSLRLLRRAPVCYFYSSPSRASTFELMIAEIQPGST